MLCEFVVLFACCCWLNVGLNLLWIPSYGVLGAAYATLVAYGAGFVASIVLGRGATRMPIPLGDLGRILLATAGMVLLLLPLRMASGAVFTFLAVRSGLGIYLGLTYLLNPGEIRTWLRRSQPA